MELFIYTPKSNNGFETKKDLIFKIQKEQKEIKVEDIKF